MGLLAIAGHDTNLGRDVCRSFGGSAVEGGRTVILEDGDKLSYRAAEGKGDHQAGTAQTLLDDAEHLRARSCQRGILGNHTGLAPIWHGSRCARQHLVPLQPSFAARAATGRGHTHHCLPAIGRTVTASTGDPSSPERCDRGRHGGTPFLLGGYHQIGDASTFPFSPSLPHLPTGFGGEPAGLPAIGAPAEAGAVVGASVANGGPVTPLGRKTASVVEVTLRK